MPSMETSVALLVCHVSVADCPLSMVSGLTEIEAVGDCAGGGGGGGGGAVFLWQAPSIKMPARAATVASTFKDSRFMFFLSTLILLRTRNLFKFKRSVLFPTPVRLRITSGKS